MSFKSQPATLTSEPQSLFECPAATEAAVIIGIANTTAETLAYTLSFYDASLDASFDLAAEVEVDANTTAKFPFPVAMEAGDILSALASDAGLTAFATVTQGTPGPQFTGLTPRGAYDAETTYAQGDVAADAGSSYVSRIDGNVGNTPASSPAEWMLLAGKGETGADGTDGEDGADGAGSGDMIAAVYDPNSVADDAFAMANMAEDTTHKVMTGAERTKLTGIETAADVTDAENVGAAIAGTSAKGSIVDADRVGGTDSAADDGLVYWLWSTVKSTLKTYFDTVYAAVVHTHAFADLTSKPTTLDGYGITDALPKSGGTLTGTLTLANDPSSALHAATKQYVDGLAVNLGKRGRVRAATTANITISTALNNGDTLDGVTLATGDLVLVKNQTTASQNGVYVVGATPARSPEYDAWDEFPGSLLGVAEGSTNGDTIWLCTSNAGGTLDTTAIAFTQLRVAGELLASDIGVTVQAHSAILDDVAGVTLTGNANKVVAVNAAGTHLELQVASGGGGGKTQIGSTLNPTSGATVGFTSIPTTYSDLELQFSGIRCDGTGASAFGLNVEVSTDNFATTVPGYDPVYIAGVFWDQTVNAISGVIRIANYNGAVVLLDGAYGEDNGVGGSGVSPLAAHISAPINAVRLIAITNAATSDHFIAGASPVVKLFGKP